MFSKIHKTLNFNKIKNKYGFIREIRQVGSRGANVRAKSVVLCYFYCEKFNKYFKDETLYKKCHHCGHRVLRYSFSTYHLHCPFTHNKELASKEDKCPSFVAHRLAGYFFWLLERALIGSAKTNIIVYLRGS